MNSHISDYVVFNDQKLASKYRNKKIPMSEFVEAYINEQIDVKTDVMDLVEAKDLFVNYQLITQKHLEFFVTRFVPEVLIHSQKQDEEIGREHYDRGNDFFNWFLGERMIYTSAFFQTGNETLERAQDNKLELIADKMRLKEGEKFLDIGCGWGTLALHAAEKCGCDATGVTVARHQTQYANDRFKAAGVADHARVLTVDYRDIPKKKYDKISCIEMAEHVGVKNFQKFMKQCYNLLTDDGIFYLQIAGLRRRTQMEDLVWGLFMNKYIFPGADASMPLGFVVNQLEKAGFEVHSVENVGIHYSHTIHRWYDNWMSNKELVLQKYGEKWFRLWAIFLAWSVIIARRGASTCFQIVANKNLNNFDRTLWYGRRSELGGQRVSLGAKHGDFDESDAGKDAPKRAPGKKAPESDQPTIH